MHTIPEFMAAVDPRRDRPAETSKEPHMPHPRTLGEKRTAGGLFHSLSDVIAALREHSGAIRELTREIREARETLLPAVAERQAVKKDRAHLPQEPVVPR